MTVEGAPTVSALEAEIRPAAPEEAELLTEIAIASKAHWGYDARFMDRFAAVIAIDSHYLAQNEVWVAQSAGKVAGFYGLVHHGAVAELDHLWLLPAYIGQGLGRRLFEHAVARAAARGAQRLEWEAEPNAVGFYRRMGGATARETTSELGRRMEVFALDLPRRTEGDG
jgi:GNAT superfamily N-acetyltransferase